MSGENDAVSATKDDGKDDGSVSTEAFLRAVLPEPLPGERIRFVALGGAAAPVERFVTDVGEGARFVRTWAGRDLYFAPALRDGPHGDAAHAARLQALWADVDGKCFAEDKRGAMTALQALPLPPSVVVDSGHGYHAYWRLAAPLDAAQEGARARAIMRGLRRLLATAPGALRPPDAVDDLARLLRLPGTYNHKTTPPRPVRVVWWHPDRRYHLGDFLALGIGAAPDDQVSAPPGAATVGTAGPDRGAAAAGRIRTGERNVTLTRLAGGLRSRGLDEPAIAAALQAINRASCDPPLPDHEVARIAQSVGRYPPGARGVLDDATPPPAEPPDPTDPDKEQDDPPAPPFPVEVLPPLARGYTRAGAEAMVCPADYIGLPLLVAAGAAVGGACELELRPGWREGTNLYAAVIGEPGSKKSPALEVALRPLVRVQALLAREWRAEHKRYAAALLEWERTPRAEQGPKPAEPPFPHLLSTDATCEALAALLAPGCGVLLALDELSGWVAGMNQYKNGRGNDRQFFLKAWSRGLLKVDRKHTPTPVLAERPSLSVVGGIQPDLLPLLADPLGRDDGFVDRLLLAYPAPVPDRWTEAGLDDAMVDAVTAVVLRLRRWAEDATRPEGAPVVVRLSPSAKELWKEWYEAHTATPAPEGLAGPWAKLPSQAARLGLILHCLRAAEAGEPAIPNELAPETLAGALDVIDEYIKPHWQKAAPRLRREPTARAATEAADLSLRIVAALRESGPLSMRGLHALFGRNLPADRLRQTLATLAAAGVVRRESSPTGRGRPAEIWRLP